MVLNLPNLLNLVMHRLNVILKGSILCGRISTLVAHVVPNIFMHPINVFLQIASTSCCVSTLITLKLFVSPLVYCINVTFPVPLF